jgi:hypothetical protein
MNQDEIPGPVAMAFQTPPGCRDLDFDLNGTASGVLHAHEDSFGSGFRGSGCATTTRRCKRAQGADSSWYFGHANASPIHQSSRPVAKLDNRARRAYFFVYRPS